MVLYFSHGAPAFFPVEGKRKKLLQAQVSFCRTAPVFYLFFVLDERKKVLLRAEQKTASPSVQALRDVQNAAHTSCCCQHTW